MRLDPLGLGVQPGLSQSACPHASHLLCGDEPGLLQDADVLLHAGQRHLELLGEARDRRFRPSKLLDHAAAGSVGKRRERKIEIRSRILNHMVQYYAMCGRAQGDSNTLSPVATTDLDRGVASMTWRVGAALGQRPFACGVRGARRLGTNSLSSVE